MVLEASSKGERYEAILMDLNMPIKDGFKAGKELRSLHR